MADTIHELHQLGVTIYPAGSQVYFNELIEANIITPNYEDLLDPYPEDDAALTTTTGEIVAVHITWLGEGMDVFETFLESEVGGVGFDDVFDEFDWTGVIAVAHSLAAEYAHDTPELLKYWHSVTFLALFSVKFEADIRHYGDEYDDSPQYTVSFVKRVTMDDLITTALEQDA